MIGKYLEISTAHIKRETAEYLEETIAMDDNGSGCGLTKGGVIAYSKDIYGFFIPVTMDPGLFEDQMNDEPEDLVNLLRAAKERGCNWIILDGDAGEDPELPVYNW